MRALKAFLLAYPRRSLIVLLAFLVAGPADAVSEIKAQAAYVCKQAGGAVREFCDCILQLNRRLAA